MKEATVRIAEILLTEQSVSVLDMLIATGHFGRSRQEAIARIVDAKLLEFVEPIKFRWDGRARKFNRIIVE
jgi:hypothetical protein